MRGIQDLYTASKKVVDFWGYDNRAVLYSSSIGALVFPPSYSTLPKPYSLNNHQDLKLLAVYFIGTVVVFKACRGRFSSVLPSSVKHPGAFANVGILGSHRYAHKGQRVKIMQMGRKLGCHTCGRKWFSKSFIADHQPPLALSHNRGKKYLFGILHYPKPQQKLYPQCKHCSLKQQKHIQSPSNYSAVVTHASSLRIYHLFLPLPYIWAFIRDVAYYI